MARHADAPSSTILVESRTFLVLDLGGDGNKNICKMRIPKEQIAYYAFHMAHDAKMWDAMEKYYDEALKFKDGAEGTQQAKISSYLERKDTVAWAKAMHDVSLQEPQKHTDLIQILLSYYQKQGLDKMMAYADEVLAADKDVLIANYGKGYAYFAQEKYDEAFACYRKCNELKPDYYDAWYQAGLCKFRQALAKNATVSNIKNQVKAKARTSLMVVWLSSSRRTASLTRSSSSVMVTSRLLLSTSLLRARISRSLLTSALLLLLSNHYSKASINLTYS